MKQRFGLVLLMSASLMLPSGARAAPPAGATPAVAGNTTANDLRVVFPEHVPQGAMVLGKVPVGSVVEYRERRLRLTPHGTVVLGVGRDEHGPLRILVRHPDGSNQAISIAVTPRDWPIERVNGVPPKTVNPPPQIAARIAREQAQVAAARVGDAAHADFVAPFIWPVKGRISGRFGNQRIYDGSPRSPHSGMDIAVPTGTPVKAPAAGIITFAASDLYLTGGTVLIDHGHGISSNFLHLSRIDVQVGERVEQGQVIAAVGATGRATGPHLHWGMGWFDVRIDPLLLVEATP